jgi:AraC-like DNA-binding protein
MKLEVPAAPFYPGRDFFTGDAIPLRVLHMEPSPPYPSHRHDFNELVVVYEGTGRHLVDGAAYELRRGDVFLIPRGSSHAYADPSGLCYVNVIFDSASLFSGETWPAGPDSLSSGKYHGGPVRDFWLSAFALREIVGVINRIDQELFQRRDGYAFMAKALFMQLWCILGRKYAERDDVGTSVPARVARVIRYLDREGGPEVSVADMAEDAGTCIRNFHREFKKATGSAPLAYINQLRIGRACGLLRETDKTITQIAGLVGYDDSNYFARQFKRFKGLSPKRFREGGL